MNKILVICSCLLLTYNVKAQVNALTENGRAVVLFQDGTWKYAEDSSGAAGYSPADSLTTNGHPFTKTSGATFLVKSNVLNTGVYINPAKWIFQPRRDNEKNPEYRFSMKAGDGYAMMVTEKTQIELESMRQIALSNAQKSSMDVRETSAEYRIVNNKKVLCLKLQGTIKGIKFAYFGYYYSNANGTVQLLTYTSLQFFESLQKEMELFLNGLVEINK